MRGNIYSDGLVSLYDCQSEHFYVGRFQGAGRRWRVFLRGYTSGENTTVRVAAARDVDLKDAVSNLGMAFQEAACTGRPVPVRVQVSFPPEGQTRAMTLPGGGVIIVNEKPLEPPKGAPAAKKGPAKKK